MKAICQECYDLLPVGVSSYTIVNGRRPTCDARGAPFPRSRNAWGQELPGYEGLMMHDDDAAVAKEIRCGRL